MIFLASWRRYSVMIDHTSEIPDTSARKRPVAEFQNFRFRLRFQNIESIGFGFGFGFG